MSERHGKSIHFVVVLAALCGVAGVAQAEKIGRRVKPYYVAQAVQPAACDVVEIQASNDGTNIDASLNDVKGKLSGLKWTSYKQLGRQKLTTPHKKPTSGKLTNGGKVTLLYKDKVSEAKRPRLRFGVDIEDKDGTQIASTTTTFDSGDWILISGEPDDKGVYILAIGCTAK